MGKKNKTSMCFDKICRKLSFVSLNAYDPFPCVHTKSPSVILLTKREHHSRLMRLKFLHCFNLCELCKIAQSNKGKYVRFAVEIEEIRTLIANCNCFASIYGLRLSFVVRFWLYEGQPCNITLQFKVW